jgi:hypothetical protein
MWPFRKKSTSGRTLEADPFLGDATAKRLGDALAARDWAAARDILSAPMTNDDRAFYMEVAANTSGVQDWIDNAIRDDASSTLPLLVKGTHAVFWAWEARGTGLSSTVGEDKWKVWFRRLKLAEDCLDEVIDRDPKCLEAWHFLVILGRARQLTKEECWKRFNNLIAIDPTHHYGHDQMLQNLCAKWSGSAEAMFAFARDRAATAPGTSLPALIATAHLEHRFSQKDAAEYMEQKEVGDELVAAAHQSIWHPSYQRTLATPYLWNRFALAFSLADRFAEAERLFQEIGDDYYTDSGWSPATFVRLRNYVRSNLPKQA